MLSEAEVRRMVAATVMRLLPAPSAPQNPPPADQPSAHASQRRLIYQDEVRALPIGSALHLAPGARLSPLAQESVLYRKIRVLPALATPESPVAPKVVALGSDHGGFALKESLKKYLDGAGFKLIDVGTMSAEPVDYPDFAFAVAKMVADGQAWRGIMVDGAGIGSCMVANKVPGVRASLCYDVSSASNAREHNDANVLTLGGSLIGTNLAQQIVKTWLSTDFGGGRHARRVNKIIEVEKRFART